MTRHARAKVDRGPDAAARGLPRLTPSAVPAMPRGATPLRLSDGGAIRLMSTTSEQGEGTAS